MLVTVLLAQENQNKAGRRRHKNPARGISSNFFELRRAHKHAHAGVKDFDAEQVEPFTSQPAVVQASCRLGGELSEQEGGEEG